MRWWPELLVIVAEVGLTATHFLEPFRHLFPASGDRLVYIGSAQLLVAVFYLAMRVGTLVHTTKDEFLYLTRKLAGFTHMSFLRPADFYVDIAGEIKRAQNAISLSHLDKKPPSLIIGSSEKAYYDELPGLIRKKGPTTVRRLERLSRDKLQWLEWVIANFEGVPNFSLGGIVLDERDEKTLAVSIQVIDSQTTYLVDVARQQFEHVARDIKISNPEFAGKWQRYFEDVLWARSKKIITNGTLVEPNWRALLK